MLFQEGKKNDRQFRQLIVPSRLDFSIVITSFAEAVTETTSALEAESASEAKCASPEVEPVSTESILETETFATSASDGRSKGSNLSIW